MTPKHIFFWAALLQDLGSDCSLGWGFTASSVEIEGILKGLQPHAAPEQRFTRCFNFCSTSRKMFGIEKLNKSV
jgi:hypothetical protein